MAINTANELADQSDDVDRGVVAVRESFIVEHFKNVRSRSAYFSGLSKRGFVPRMVEAGEGGSSAKVILSFTGSLPHYKNKKTLSMIPKEKPRVEN